MALPRLSGCQVVQGTVRAVFIEPVAKVIEPALDSPLRQACQHQTPPEAKGPERPLDLAVQVTNLLDWYNLITGHGIGLDDFLAIGERGFTLK
ncbi:hypothetical protein LCGC14_2703180, partial [marine sediment metagenome]